MFVLQKPITYAQILHIAHETANCRNPPIHIFTGNRKYLDRSSKNNNSTC